MLEGLSSTFLSLLAALGLAGAPAESLQGYVEADYILVAPQLSGQIETLEVQKGAQVKKGEPLFVLEHRAESLALERAEAQVAASAAQLADLLKSKRQPELDALVAQRDQAAAALDLAKINGERTEKLAKTKAVSQAALEADRAALDQAKARFEEALAALATGQQSVGRDDAIRAAAAALSSSEIAREEARWRLEQKQVAAPQDAFVFDTIYRAGEYVGAGAPVVSLLPAENIKVRFFVAAPQLQALALRQAVEIEGAGTPPLRARIAYISPKAEYTPPQLFNRDNRERLLYMIEAVPEREALRLHPGQPVDVRLLQDTTKR